MSGACVVVTTAALGECRDFYVRALDASLLEHGDGYARLRFRGCELLFVLPAQRPRLPMFQRAAPTHGLSMVIDTGNLLHEYDELIRRGLAPLGPLREYDSGERSFTLIDPAGTVLNFVERAQPLF